MSDTEAKKPDIAANDGLRKLIEGNERFMRGEARFPTVCKETLADLARAQRPYATIVGCSDSRVPPELIFDASFGELFIVRIAGNVISPEVLGSLQYAGTHLRTTLFVILGHEGCGAVHAALKHKLDGEMQRCRIQRLVDTILPGLPPPDDKLSEQEQLARAVEANVFWSMHQILEIPEAQEAIKDGSMLVGAIYEITSGRVRFLSNS